MYDPPQTLPLPKIVNLLTDMKEERDVAWLRGRTAGWPTLSRR
jgi:hypothetical protein